MLSCVGRPMLPLHVVIQKVATRLQINVLV